MLRPLRLLSIYYPSVVRTTFIYIDGGSPAKGRFFSNWSAANAYLAKKCEEMDEEEGEEDGEGEEERGEDGDERGGEGGEE